MKLSGEYDKEKIRELAKKIKEKKIVVGLEFQALLFKALETPTSFTPDNIKVMQEELDKQFPSGYGVWEIQSYLNSIKEVLRKKELIL
jgi:hypothetical protein